MDGFSRLKRLRSGVAVDLGDQESDVSSMAVAMIL
jgi:hypothetical protein